MDRATPGFGLSTRLIAYSAAAMYAGAAFLGLSDGYLPGGPDFSVVPGLVALGLVIVIITVGPRLPRAGLAPLGPIGVALIAIALATTRGAGDGAVLYMWPVLWSASFFGGVGAISTVACVGVAHAIALSILPAADGYPARWLDVMVSVSIVAAVTYVLARRNAELLARVTVEARTDKLTGVLNRRGFGELATQNLAQARRDNSSIAIAAFDLDFFKAVNDGWGHEIGDQVIARFAKVLVANTRDADVVARAGGEEFAVLLPNCDAERAADFTERVRDALASDDHPDLPSVHTSAGVAAAVAPATIETLLQEADNALYAAKRGGRNRTVVFQYDEAND